MKQIRYFLQAVLVYLIFLIMRFLPLDTASNFGGWLARSIGPRLAKSRQVIRHLQYAMPHLRDDEARAIMVSMWDNLGRNFAETPHINRICNERVTVSTPDTLHYITENENGSIIFSGHLANWEVGAAYVQKNLNAKLAAVHRLPNNPFLVKILTAIRNPNEEIRSLPKSRKGARDFIRSLNENYQVYLLIDQKYNEGIESLFFGKPAMASSAFSDLSQKMNVPAIPMRMIRKGGAHFEMQVFPPLALYHQDGTPLTPEEAVALAHTYLEGWIREYPGDWLWLHKRWIEKV
jgi:KDO2-lipid IV(A) lauroyltransferase